MRERDRYMFQWYDYKCKGCGNVWTKHSVTISFRQTAVSTCITQKRSCASRPEFDRMYAGEKFITNGHCENVGGTRLSPTSKEVLDMDKQGLLVGINPVTRQKEYFIPHPTKIGLKVAP